jgi:hypothetical protein
VAGVFLLTWDVEALWGDPERSTDRATSVEVGLRFRGIIRDIISVLDEFDIPATFAIVGHLYLEECSLGAWKHPEMVHPEHEWHADWYANDPCTDHVKDPGWYAPEVVHWVRNALAGHEIGCHSFSHCVFGDAGCTREVAVSEVSRCRELASLHGISLTSFVFPRNSVGHLDVLRRSGFSCFRGPTSGWYSSLPKRLSRICSVIDEFLPIAPRLVTPSIEDGIVDIPGSMLIRSRNQWRKLLPVHMTERKIIRGIRRCASESGIFHLWSHPLNLAWNREAMLTMLRNMASVVAEERSKGRLRVVTMSEYADMYTSRSVPG